MILRYAVERNEQKQAAEQKRYKKNLYKKIQSRIELQAGSQVHIDGPPPRAQCSENRTTSPLTIYSKSVNGTVKEGSRELLAGSTGTQPARSVSESTVTLEKAEVAIPMSPDRVREMPSVSSSTGLTAGLYSNAYYYEPDM